MKLPLVATLAIAIVSIALSSVSAQTPEASQKRVSKWIEQLDSPDFDTELQGEVTLRGKAEKITVYAVSLASR